MACRKLKTKVKRVVGSLMFTGDLYFEDHCKLPDWISRMKSNQVISHAGVLSV